MITKLINTVVSGWHCGLRRTASMAGTTAAGRASVRARGAGQADTRSSVHSGWRGEWVQRPLVSVRGTDAAQAGTVELERVAAGWS